MARKPQVMVGVAVVVAALVVAAAGYWLFGRGGAAGEGSGPATPARRDTDEIMAAMRRPGAGRPQGSMTTKATGERRRPVRTVAVPPQGQVERIGQLIAKAGTLEEKTALLAELQGLGGQAVANLLAQLLDDPNAEFRLAVVELMAEQAGTEQLPVIDKALGDQDQDVREAAIDVLDAIEEPNACAPLLTRALGDENEDVRDAAFAVLDNKLPEEQNLVFAAAISSPHKDVRSRTVDMLSYVPSHTGFTLLAQALRDPDQEIVDEARWTLDYFVSEEFDTTEQALAWWAKNKDR